jgi:hypothetical protein
MVTVGAATPTNRLEDGVPDAWSSMTRSAASRPAATGSTDVDHDAMPAPDWRKFAALCARHADGPSAVIAPAPVDEPATPTV